jgi:beta-glucanase (GH16 family)
MKKDKVPCPPPHSPWKTSLLLAVACLALALPAAAQTWNLAWSDEFDGATIDATKWTFDHGDLRVNNEIEYYCGPAADPANQSPCSQTPNARLDGNGHLLIQAIRVSPSVTPHSNAWTSARLKTSGLATFQYGRIESSMQLPTGAGIWPAFWALGTNIDSAGWPACGEQDYMENVPASSGQGPTIISSTLHGPTYSGSNGIGKPYVFPTGEQVDTAYHTYGAIWSPSMIQFYVDNPTNVFFVKTANEVPGGTAQWAFNHPFFLIMNLAVGGTGSWPGPPDNSTPSPATMYVDYVRHYTASPLPPPSLGTPAPIVVKAGASSSNTTTVNLTSASDIGRVYLSCSTNAPQASCSITSNDPLNIYTVDFSKTLAPTAKVTIATAQNLKQASLLPRSLLARTLTLVFAAALLFAFRNRGGKQPIRVTLGNILFFALIVTSCGGANNTTTGGGTTPGNYTITVNAYTVSNTSGAPDATTSIALTVN